MAVTGEEVRLAIGKAMESDGWLRGTLVDDADWKSRTDRLLELHRHKVIELDSRSCTTMNVVQQYGRDDNRWLASDHANAVHNRTVQFKVLQPQSKLLQLLSIGNPFESIDSLQEFMEKRYERARSLSVRRA